MIRFNVATLRTKFWLVYFAVSVTVTLTLLSISETSNFRTDILVKDFSFADTFSLPKILDSAENPVSFTIQNGDTLSSILKNAQLNDVEVSEIIREMRKTYDPSKISIGQNISVFYDDYNPSKVSAIKLSVSPEKTIEISRQADASFNVKEITIPLVKHYVHIKGKIDGSLFGTAANNAIPQVVISDIVKVFSYDIDFQRDIHEGDSFELVFERFYDTFGNFARDGKPVYMGLTLAGEDYKLYYYEGKNSSDYYNEDGSSVRKELLKTPVNAARISSGFGVRKHPIHGYSKMHKGVDFAAPIGTPIYAAGDGVIEEIGRKGTYGNYIRVRHNGGFSTAYAHCSRFNKGLRNGARVKQGDVIAFVGTTGHSTGPHLHFEVLKNNHHINPLKVKFNSNYKMSGNDLKDYKKYINKISRKLLSMPSHSEIAADSIKDL
ncbi:MAG: peptidoglycan DD-metalloendopeptidase family protein [Sphingobacteriia bacterium]|nr:peptidoglycan DD-metalloendopeptidase family protein [Sphingobacteriia bacterium]